MFRLPKVMARASKMMLIHRFVVLIFTFLWFEF